MPLLVALVGGGVALAVALINRPQTKSDTPPHDTAFPSVTPSPAASDPPAPRPPDTLTSSGSVPLQNLDSTPSQKNVRGAGCPDHYHVSSCQADTPACTVALLKAVLHDLERKGLFVDGKWC